MEAKEKEILIKGLDAIRAALDYLKVSAMGADKDQLCMIIGALDMIRTLQRYIKSDHASQTLEEIFQDAASSAVDNMMQEAE